jgi:dihydroorotase
LPEAFLYGFAYVLETTKARGAFLNGDYSTICWPSFFPWTFALKTTFPLLIAALLAGLVDGTADCIATDHAPHAGHTKEQPLDTAPPGMLGLETALGVLNTAVTVTPQQIASLMSWAPARIAEVSQRHGRPIAVGEPANITVWDTTTVWTVSRDHLSSKSRNTPFHGMDLRGRVRHTVFNGELVVRDGKALK